MERSNIISILIAVLIAGFVLIIWHLNSKNAEHQTGQQFQEIVDSSVQDIHGVYGTKEQKTRYPTYTDLIEYGVTSVPRWDIDKYSGMLTQKTPVVEPKPKKKSLNPFCGAAFN